MIGRSDQYEIHWKALYSEYLALGSSPQSPPYFWYSAPPRWTATRTPASLIRAQYGSKYGSNGERPYDAARGQVDDPGVLVEAHSSSFDGVVDVLRAG